MAERVLITGSAGFVGRHLAAYLSGQRLEIYGLDRREVHPPSDWPGHWYSGDVMDADQVLAIAQETEPDYVFHLAALIKSDSLTDLFAVNVIGTQNVLDGLAAIQSKAHVLVTGSSAEYGLAHPDELPIREENPLRPLSPYGVSKVAQSLLAAQYGYRHGLHVVRTRTFNLTGPGEPDVLVCSNFARQISEMERGLRSLVLKVGNLDTRRDFLDIRDAVRAYWLVARYGDPGEVYNVCSGTPVLIRKVLEVLLDETNLQIEIREDPQRYTNWDIPNQFGDSTKLRRVAKWLRAIPLQDSLKDLLNFWRAQLNVVNQYPHEPICLAIKASDKDGYGK